MQDSRNRKETEINIKKQPFTLNSIVTGSDLLFAMGRNTEDCKYAKFWYLDKAHKAVTLNLCFLSVGTLLTWQIETICLSQKVNCMISYANHH